MSATAVNATSATINWTTSVAANSQVAYGTTAAYGSTTPLNSAFTTSHAVNLKGLFALHHLPLPGAFRRFPR